MPVGCCARPASKPPRARPTGRTEMIRPPSPQPRQRRCSSPRRSSSPAAWQPRPDVVSGPSASWEPHPCCSPLGSSPGAGAPLHPCARRGSGPGPRGSSYGPRRRAGARLRLCDPVRSALARPIPQRVPTRAAPRWASFASATRTRHRTRPGRRRWRTHPGHLHELSPGNHSSSSDGTTRRRTASEGWQPSRAGSPPTSRALSDPVTFRRPNETWDPWTPRPLSGCSNRAGADRSLP